MKLETEFMGANHAKSHAIAFDPLIEEVRTHRRNLAAKFDNDLDRLARHLRKLQADYENRAGQFVNLPKHVDEELFPTMTRAIVDPTHEEVRALRTAPPRKPRSRRRN